MNQSGSGCSFGNFMVSQEPRYDNQVRKKKRRKNENQVISGQGIIRPDLRNKTKFL